MPPKKSLEGPFKKGVKVKAKWSGSNSFFDAKVLEVYSKTCKVEFEDGTVFSVKHTDIKSLKEDKTEKDFSPKRTRSRSRSVGRPRSRSRSPARKEKKETLTKRGRTPKDEKKRSEEISKTTNNVIKDETDSIVKSSLTREKIGSLTSKEETKSSVSSVLTTNSITKSFSISMEKKEPTEIRLRSTRLAALRSADIPPVESQKTYEPRNAVLKKDEAQYSDEEESDEEEIIVVPKGPSKLKKTFYFIFTLLKIILPTTLLFLAFACTKKQCTILEVPQFYSRWRDVGNALKFPLPSVMLFHLTVCLLSLIPLGKKVKGFPFGPKGMTKDYYVNGIFILLIGIVVFFVCFYFGIYMNWGYDKFKALTLSTLLYCTFCSLIMHIVSLVKGDGTKESKIPLIGNFFNGVYCNPFLFGKIDIKTSFVRAGLIGSVLLNLSIVLKFFLMKGYVTIPLACTALMQIAFVSDYFIREEKMLSTATYTSDCVGYGFMMTTGFLIPFGLALQIVYLFIFDTKANLTPHYCYAAMVAVFFVGYYIYVKSGNLKHNFRHNPFSPSLSDVDSIPTSQKKRLISSSLWGVVRHPNYLGLIGMAFAWTLPCGFSHFTPFGPVVLLVVALIARTFRVESECKEKYGPAWNNYIGKVRSRLIPYIF